MKKTEARAKLQVAMEFERVAQGLRRSVPSYPEPSPGSIVRDSRTEKLYVVKSQFGRIMIDGSDNSGLTEPASWVWYDTVQGGANDGDGYDDPSTDPRHGNTPTRLKGGERLLKS